MICIVLVLLLWLHREHADMIMVTGVVTRNLAQAVQMTYEAMEEPKLVMACGACAASGERMGLPMLLSVHWIKYCR